MFWQSKPDNRPASASAIAIAESLRKEPERWRPHGDNYLRHDCDIIIGSGGYTFHPNLDDEPDANGDVIAAAVDDWVAKVMKMPPAPAVNDRPPPPPSDS
jgi:hypothetical protein